MISIHASRGGSDHFETRYSITFHISIHASRGGSDTFTCFSSHSSRFQSTLPAREATTYSRRINLTSCDFNPRFPRGKRRRIRAALTLLHAISIHASREGSDAYVLAVTSA